MDLSRLPVDLRTRVSDLLDGSVGEDPDEVRDHLRAVERTVSDLATERDHLRDRVEALVSDVEALDEHAREAIREGDEEHAREYVEDKHRARGRIDRLQERIEVVGAAEARLLERRDQLVERLRTTEAESASGPDLEPRRTSTDAAEGADDVQPLPTGSPETGPGSDAVREARDATARASALDELHRKGVYDGPLSSGLDDEIRSEAVEESVEDELNTIRGEVDDGDEGSNDR